jgi:hypothetical protein
LYDAAAESEQPTNAYTKTAAAAVYAVYRGKPYHTHSLFVEIEFVEIPGDLGILELQFCFLLIKEQSVYVSSHTRLLWKLYPYHGTVVGA